MPEWLVLVRAYSLAYKVPPELSLALAEGEGTINGKLYFGRRGRYYLPFGLYVKCKVPRADTPGGNAEGGIKAIARHLHKSRGNLRLALRKYNTGDKGKKFDDYCKNIEQRMAKHIKDRTFGK